MDKLPVGQLPDLQQSNNDDEIMVITNSEYNQLKKEKISDLITDFTSTNENNALTKGTDGKMFVTDFGNASNITEGTLPTSVLPDIPKSKLPDIETADLPLSGVTADTYAYPSSVTVNAQGQVTGIVEGAPGANNANQDLSNISSTAYDLINQSKALETGNVSSNTEVYADVLSYAHSTFDLSKFTVVGSPTVTDDGIASGFSESNYLSKDIVCDYNTSFLFRLPDFITGDDINSEQFICTIKKYTFLASIKNGQINITASASVDNTNRVFASEYRGTISPNTKYSVYISWENNTYNIYIKGGIYNNWELLYSKSSSEKILLSGKLYYGLREDYPTLFYRNNLDLKSSYLVADGISIFNGNITGTDTYTINEEETQIPYTLSKTGSKIVDVAYRDKVQALYQEQGYAPYYTIDEQNQNFTLPMGEVYGMIERKLDAEKTPHVIEKFVDGKSGYRLYSDGYCEQWGFCDFATSNYTTINLLKAYRDVNYLVFVSLGGAGIESSKNILGTPTSESAFTLTAESAERAKGVYWRTLGYTNLEN